MNKKRMYGNLKLWLMGETDNLKVQRNLSNGPYSAFTVNISSQSHFRGGGRGTTLAKICQYQEDSR